MKVTGISVNKNLLLNNVLGLALDWFSEILIVKFIGVFQESIFNLLFNSKTLNKSWPNDAQLYISVPVSLLW